MYRVLVVDDELPALRFISSIVEKDPGAFEVAGALSSGKQALDFLKKHPVDLLITDISMHGMNGIELSQAVRNLLPNIHIVIVSGYGEFEYAQGAIKARVDEYLLKPVSPSRMSAILRQIEQKLDSENANLSASLLPAIACGLHYPAEIAEQLYGRKSFRFALIRWENLDMTLPKSLGATSLVLPENEYFQALRGRDESERILIAPDQPMEEFLTNLSVYMTSPGSLSTWTAIYTPIAKAVETLPTFLEMAFQMLYRKTVVGKHQILQFTGGATEEERVQLPAAEMKQLSYFISAGKYRMIKDYFIFLASTWERSQMPQRQVWHMGRQIIHQVASVYQPANKHLEELLLEFNELIRCAASYGDLMSSLYSILLDNGNIRDRKLSPQELYEYAADYITENYAQPLSMQSVCDAVGISQTYLSRLFRQYSDTTFNNYLTRCRMEAAMKLLREKPELLLRDVAACVGYEDSSYFTKVFHQYTGQTPSQYATGK